MKPIEAPPYSRRQLVQHYKRLSRRHAKITRMIESGHLEDTPALRRAMAENEQALKNAWAELESM